jgi:quercetin dioxygenase-like cupin family protein
VSLGYQRGNTSEVRVRPGEFVIVPKGIEHLPIAEPEVMWFDRAQLTLNTGNVADSRTMTDLERTSSVCSWN